MASSEISTFEEVFQKYGFLAGASNTVINGGGVTIPPEGSSIPTIVAAGNGGGLSDQNLEDAWKLLSVYRASLTATGNPAEGYLWLYNALLCHFFQRSNSILVAGGELESSSAHMSAERSSLEEDRKKFREQKNRLITLMSKNKNIAAKYQRSYILTWLLFLALVFYTIVMSMLIMNANNVDKSLNKAAILAFSSIVLGLIFMYKIYSVVTKFNLEGFTEPSVCPEHVTDTTLVREKMVEILDNYLSSYKILKDYNNMVGDTGTVEQRKIIRTILNDYNNANYVNMRKYQLTDYRLESSMHSRRFVMYGFVLVSVIGMLSVSLASSGPLKGMFATISTSLVCLYVVTYMLYLRQNMSRKRYNWNKLYWVLNKN